MLCCVFTTKLNCHNTAFAVCCNKFATTWTFNILTGSFDFPDKQNFSKWILNIATRKYIEKFELKVSQLQLA